MKDPAFGEDAVRALATAESFDLLIMLQNERQDLNHLPVAARLPEQMLLQPFEGFG